MARLHGGYEISIWAPVGALVLVLTAALAAIGLRPYRIVFVAALLFVALAAWGALSTTWGGVPNSSWQFLDQGIIAASALVLGALLAGAGVRAPVLAGIFTGVTINATELLLRPAIGSLPETWYYRRTLDGTVGYHNAQGGLLVLALPLAVWLLSDRRPIVRMTAGAAATVLMATILLTQSRTSVGAAVLGLGLTLAWARNTTLVLRAIPLAVAGGLLVLQLRGVDTALARQEMDTSLVGGANLTDALRTYAAWSLLLAVGVAVSAMPVIRNGRIRKALLLGAAVVVLAGVIVALGGEARSDRPFAAIRAGFDDGDPGREVPAGSTRLASLSLNGRRDAWRVSAQMIRESPLVGLGQGSFPRRWTEERQLEELFLLQPHSLGFELFGQLGLIGLGLYAAAVCLSGVGAARGKTGSLPPRHSDRSRPSYLRPCSTGRGRSPG